MYYQGIPNTTQYHIYLHLISVVFTYGRYDLTLCSDSKRCILIYSSQWIWVRMIMNIQSKHTHLSLYYEVFYELESNGASNFVFLTWILIWNGLVVFFSSFDQSLLRFSSLYTIVQIIFLSTSELLFAWLLESMAIIFFFLASILRFFGFNIGYRFQHSSSMCSSILQGLQWLLKSRK